MWVVCMGGAWVVHGWLSRGMGMGEGAWGVFCKYSEVSMAQKWCGGCGGCRRKCYREVRRAVHLRDAL